MDPVDLTFLGLGMGLTGFPVYIENVLFMVHPDQPSPYLYPAVAGVLSALCYAELISRCTGNAFSEVYRRIGKFPAMMIGWLIVIQNLARCAFVFSTIENYFGSQILLDWSKQELLWLLSKVNILFGIGTIIFLQFITKANKAVISYGVAVIISISLMAGSISALKKWKLPAEKFCQFDMFLPSGSRIIETLGSVVIIFTSFDVLAHAVGQRRDRGLMVPIALIVLMAIIVIVYALEAHVFSLSSSYCETIMKDKTFASTKERVLLLMSWGILFLEESCILVSAMAGVYQLSRVIRAVVERGNPQWKYPLVSMSAAVILSFGLSLLFYGPDLEQIVHLTSVILYILIASVVTYLRQTDETPEKEQTEFWSLLLNWKQATVNRKETNYRVAATSSVLMAILLYLCFFLLFALRGAALSAAKGLTLNFLILITLVAGVYYITKCKPDSKFSMVLDAYPYAVIHFLCILINCYICLTMHFSIWVKTVLLFSIGLFIYFIYKIIGKYAKKEVIDP